MNDYINALSTHLTKLSYEDRQDIINYYQEYLDDAGINNYADCVKELGLPETLAKKIMADASIKTVNNFKSNKQQPVFKKSHAATSIWLIVLAIIGSPIWFPLAIGVIFLIFGMGIAAFAIIVSILAIIAAGFFGSIVSLGWGITHLFSAFPIASLFLGGSLIVIGISIMLIPILICVSKNLTLAVHRASSWFYKKVTKRNHAEEERNK